MFYVYILRSVGHPEQIYIGATTDLKARLAKHNAGNSHPGSWSVTSRFRSKRRRTLSRLISSPTPDAHSRASGFWLTGLQRDAVSP